MKHLALIAALAVAACAKAPSQIAAVDMGNAYAGTPCAEAENDLRAERAHLETLSEKQRGAAAGDAFSVLLVGLPVASLAGGDVSGDIAATKGKIAALEMRVAGCR